MRFVAQLNDGSYTNVPAERMDMEENFLRVWLGGHLIAIVDTSAVISAHLSENGRRGTAKQFEETTAANFAVGKTRTLESEAEEDANNG